MTNTTNNTINVAGLELTAEQLAAIQATMAPVKAAKKSKTERSVVVVFSEVEATALVTTNIGFTGRTAEWILGDWRKTVKTSRPQNMKDLVNSADVQVHISDVVDCADAAGLDALKVLETQLCVHFATSGYNIISKVSKDIREAINVAVAPAAQEAVEEAAEEEVVEEAVEQTAEEIAAAKKAAIAAKRKETLAAKKAAKEAAAEEVAA